MQLGACSNICEYPPLGVDLGLVIIFDEIGFRGTWILDLLVSVTDGIEEHGSVVCQNVVAMMPVHNSGDTVRVGTCQNEGVNEWREA